MENQEINKITPQDIIDKEFRVKFRGFDMAEVDSFLEEVAENLFQLTEENTVLHEKILALEQDLEAAGSMAARSREEFHEELGNTLDDLRQDMASINADLVTLKQDRAYFAGFENNLKAAIVSLQRAAGEMKSQARQDISSAHAESLEKIKQGSEAIAAELAGLQEDRRVFNSLKSALEKVISSAKEAATALAPQQQLIAASKGLGALSRETDAIKSELTVLKQLVSNVSGMREDITKELKEMLASHFKVLEAKIVMAGERAGGAPQPKKEKLLTAEIIAQEADAEEKFVLEDYRADEDYDDEGLEFISEDDILDVDKLRNVFQSVLDEEVVDSPDKDEDDTGADLLFIDDDLLEDVPEPKVTFAMDEK